MDYGTVIKKPDIYTQDELMRRGANFLDYANYLILGDRVFELLFPEKRDDKLYVEREKSSAIPLEP